jgi:glycolate oxidase
VRDKLASIGVRTVERAGRVVALPVSACETGAIVKLARREGWMVAPSWMPAGALPLTPVHVSTERMGAITEVLPADLMAVVGAGVTVGALEERLREHAMFWPVSDEAAPDDAIGDILARATGNSTRGGNLVRKYVLGLEAVLADGAVVKTGSRTVKCVTGYDLRQLFIGSRGVFGVIASAVLRLEAAPRRGVLRATYERDFAGLAGERAGGGAPGGAPAAAPDRGSLAVLRRLKKELDPDGVFPPVEVAVGGTE